ncbi:MAG: amidohydrolase family protein [Pirellulales bacterium]|nr:amidohydrolase family protein [Pirellulales bacterium]
MTTRRKFLHTAASALAAGPFLASVSRADAPSIPIIDTHQHMWDLKRTPLAWVKSSKKLNKNFLTLEYREATKGLGVVKAVYMEVAVPKAYRNVEADWVVDLCRRNDNLTVAGVIAGSPGDEAFEDYITPYAKSGVIRGVREILHADTAKAGLWRSKVFIRGIRLLGKLGMSFDLCQQNAWLPEAIRLVDACPQTRFILDHCGNPVIKWSAEERRPWRENIAVLAKRGNVICKISGIVSQVTPGWKPKCLAPYINHCMDSFGPDRAIFAGDWPVCLRGASYRAWVEALRAVVDRRSESERRKLFHDNAAAFYKI